MKKLLGLMIYGGLLFGLSAGGAWYMKSQHELALEEQRAELEDPNAGLVPSSTDQPTLTHPNAGDAAYVEDTLRQVPVRAGAMTVEEIVQYGMGLKERDQAIQQREEALQRLDERYRLIQEDIQAEQMEIEGILAQARNQKTAADEILRQAAERVQKAEALKKDAERERKDIALEQTKAEQRNAVSPSVAAEQAAERRSNIKATAALLEGMSEDAGASTIGDLMDEGQSDLAVELLAGLEGRKAAKILEALAQQDGGADKATELVYLFAVLKRPRCVAIR